MFKNDIKDHCNSKKAAEDCFHYAKSLSNKLNLINESFQLLRHNCTNNHHGESCCEVGRIKLTGAKDSSVSKDSLEAFSLFEIGCYKGSSPKCCHALGTIHAKALASHKINYSEAARYFKRGCDLGWSSSCFHLGCLHQAGVLQSNTNDKSIDDHKVFQYFQAACNSGHKMACQNLSILYDEGKGCTKDVKKAVEIRNYLKTIASDSNIQTPTPIAH